MSRCYTRIRRQIDLLVGIDLLKYNFSHIRVLVVLISDLLVYSNSTNSCHNIIHVSNETTPHYGCISLNNEDIH